MKNLTIYCFLILLLGLTGCSTDTADSPALAPLTSSANDLFNSEVSTFSDYAYDKGQQF